MDKQEQKVFRCKQHSLFLGALLLSAKDIRLLIRNKSGIIQAVLLGFLLIFLFSLAGSKGPTITGEWIAAIFWLSSCFALILIFNALYALEEENETRLGLILAPFPLQGIWLGKALAGGLFLLIVQLFFLPACMVFLGAGSPENWLIFLGLLFSVDWGLIVLGSLLGAMGQGQGNRESLLSVIIFPLLIPLLLGGIRIGEALLHPEIPVNIYSWLELTIAFDCIFTGAALVLFPHVYGQ